MFGFELYAWQDINLSFKGRVSKWRDQIVLKATEESISVFVKSPCRATPMENSDVSSSSAYAVRMPAQWLT